MEALEAAGHVEHLRAQQQVAQQRAHPREQTAVERRGAHRAAVGEAAAKGALVALVEHAQKHRDGPRIVAEARVHLDDEFVPGLVGHAQAFEVRIDHVAVLGRPDGHEARIFLREPLAQLQRVVLARPVDDKIELPGADPVEHHFQNGGKPVEILRLVGHRHDGGPITEKTH